MRVAIIIQFHRQDPNMQLRDNDGKGVIFLRLTYIYGILLMVPSSCPPVYLTKRIFLSIWRTYAFYAYAFSYFLKP